MCIQGGNAGRKLAFISRDVCFGATLCCIQAFQNCKYIYYFTQTKNFQIKFISSMSLYPNSVSLTKIRNFEIALPPIHVQNEIVKYLDNRIPTIDLLIQNNLKIIEEIKNYRQSIISNAVLGKLNI